MSARRLVAGLVLAASIQVAVAEAPVKLTITRYIYVDPADPDSELAYTIELELRRELLDGDAIAWSVTAVQIEQHDACCDDLIWRDERDDAGEASLYWWTTHADVEQPDTTEFATMPRYTGVAAAVNPGEADLVYDLQTVECDPQDPLCDTYTVSMDFSFRYQNASVPLDEDHDEPVDSDPEPVEVVE